MAPPPLPSASPSVPGAQRFRATDTVALQNFAPRQAMAAGEAGMQLGRTVTLLADHYQRLHDEARLDEADNRLADVHRTTIYNGYLRTKGKDAFEQRDQFFKELETKERDLEQSLENDAQREAFRSRANKRRMDAMFQADRHQAIETEKDAIAQAKASVDSNVIDFVTLGPEGIGAERFAAAIAKTDELTRMSGFDVDSPVGKQARLRTTTDALSGYIDNIVEQDPKTAKSVFDQAMEKGAIDPQVAKRLRATIDQATTKQFAVTTALKLQDDFDKAVQEAERFAEQPAGAEPFMVEVAPDSKSATPVQFTAKERPASYLLYATDKLEQQLRDGKITEAQFTAARGEVAYRAGALGAEHARVATELQKKAQDYAQLTSIRDFEGLPAATQTELRANGLEPSMRLWFKNGNQYIDTQLGTAFLAASALPEQLAQIEHLGAYLEAPIPDGQGGFTTLRANLSDRSILALASNWKQARGMALQAKEAESSSVNRMMRVHAFNLGLLGKDAEDGAFDKFWYAVETTAKARAKQGQSHYDAMNEAALEVGKLTFIDSEGKTRLFAVARPDEVQAGSVRIGDRTIPIEGLPQYDQWLQEFMQVELAVAQRTAKMGVGAPQITLDEFLRMKVQQLDKQRAEAEAKRRKEAGWAGYPPNAYGGGIQ